MRTTSRLSVLVWYWGPLALYAAAIFLLSSMSNPSVPALRFAHADKVLHAIEYAGLGGLLCRALALGGRGFSGRAAVAAAVGLGALYGASDELHQLFVPPRSADPVDWLADVTGAALGAFGYHLLRLRRCRAGPASEGAA
jgi:VanZ family protein